ncbi:Neither inactivation nor afterpotential protein C [Gryllus bimaculatus]|nr:Neither inactivation nor afterpotential protein C [Gryllus bimaculatus]
MRKYNTASRGRFSQSRGLRTASGVFRAAGLEALRALAGGGVHPVRCLRASLAGAPRAAQPELLRQQLRALAVLDTARARRDGYPCRVPFAEFIRRYKFLAFEFDENVEETRDNCRLLLVRLKMEGWLMGNKKVFLTYYNEEYLSRLYETQVKKIVRVQTMLRAFLARRVVQKKTKEQLAGTPPATYKASPPANAASPAAAAAAATAGASPASTPSAAGSPAATPAASASPADTPAASPQASPKASPKSSPAATPQGSPQGSPEASPKGSPQGSPTASPAASPKASPKSSPAASPKGSPQGSPAASPKASPKSSPAASPKSSPQGSPAASPKASQGNSPAASDENEAE